MSFCSVVPRNRYLPIRFCKGNRFPPAYILNNANLPFWNAGKIKIVQKFDICTERFPPSFFFTKNILLRNFLEEFSTLLMPPFSYNSWLRFLLSVLVFLSCALDVGYWIGVETKKREFCTPLKLTKSPDVWLKFPTPFWNETPCWWSNEKVSCEESFCYWIN